MEILSLITHFEHISSWVESVDTITQVDKKWNQRKMWSKAWFVANQADVYDLIVIFFDLRFALILSICLKIVFWKNKKARIIFTTYLCDISFFSFDKQVGLFPFFYHKVRFFLHKFILKSVDRVVVHSRAEIQMYSHCFSLPSAKFVFIPYFVRADALDREMELQKDDYIIVAGRHRDYSTFIEAVRCLKIKGMIIAGNSDRSLIPAILPENIEVQYEIPFSRYREMIFQSRSLVVPLSKTSMLRSLGQVTVFEAVSMKVPIIASRTFQLTDYFQEDKDILFFEPENVDDLQKKMELIISQPELVKRLTINAYNKMMQSYTDKHYTDNLIALCKKCITPEME
jgi:glycosyltransferase involved in cell wall biosynthesis